MRPQRLELEGFTVFRDPTVVDFDGADFFALTGPTGSGKSSIVDAIVFALYGSVPRYDDKRLVAPVISQGAVEARVRLDFTVGDDAYCVARVVRRTKTGATTKEARLEGPGGEVLAGTADEVAAAVESLLGLGYEHFTKCVVLPQGAFARFLHDKPERRQELLVQLLDVGVYERMGSFARQRAQAARASTEVLEQRLATLVEATPEAVAAAEARVKVLDGVLVEVDAEEPDLAGLAARADAAAAEAARADAGVDALRSVRVPPDVAALDAALAAAAAAVEAASAEERRQVGRRERAEAALRVLPDQRVLAEVSRAHDHAARQREQRAKAERLLAERGADEQAARQALALAEQSLAEAEAVVAAVEARHRAAAVRGDLVAGAPCPVCEQPVHTLPAVAAPADLADARQTTRQAREQLDLARGEVAAAERERHRMDGKVQAIDAELTALTAAVEAAAPVLAGVAVADEGAVADALAAGSAAESALGDAVAAERRARAVTVAATAQLGEHRAGEVRARADFDAARDRVAALGPPPRVGSGLADEWAQLATWAIGESEALEASAAVLRADAGRLREEREARVRSQVERCAAVGVVVATGEQPVRAVERALATAAAAVEALVAALAEAETARGELGRLAEVREVATDLAAHLRSDRFEKWVLDEALHRLVDGATTILQDLSGGQYSLAVDARTGAFDVVDHRNAGVTRSARTLSGGETFLASLALALALADQLAQLAARGAVRLESMFLDEGFGTLDAETLDTVAAAIEELGGRGRTVGLISHVADLAERVPVRFEVTKVGVSASVRRVDT